MEIQAKSFKECTLKYLEKTFHLEELDNIPALDSWVNTPAELSDFESNHLIYLRQILDFNVHDWNEFELDSHFIGPVFTLANFSSKKFNHYAQRPIKGIIDSIELFGKPDGMIASGRREPEVPFFAFQEYKKELDPEGDPAGQALAAMLVGQALNENRFPLYGCYVVGSMWYFMAISNRDYAIANGFNALTDDIFKIFSLLKSLKLKIIELSN